MRPAFLILVFGLAAGTAMAQSTPAPAPNTPPTPQQLQQQQDQTVRNESEGVHANLAQTGSQIQSQVQEPYLTPSGRVVARPPGYIPMPR